MTRITMPRFLVILLTVVGGLWLVEQTFGLVYRMADILLLFGLAWLLKLLLDPLILRLERMRVPTGAAIAIAYLFTIGSILGGLLALTPQITSITQNIPTFVNDVALRAERVAVWLQERGVQIDPQAMTNQIAGLSTELGRNVAGQVVMAAQSILGILGRTALVVTVSVYMSLTRGRMKNVLRPVIPPRWHDEYDAFINDVNTAYSSYIRGYFYVVALGTLMSAAVLFGFRVPSAAIWLMLVLVLRLLPFIGGTLADALLVAILFFELRLTTSIIAIALVLLGQVVLTNVLMPRVMSRELGINPLLVLFAVLLGGKIYGVAGILFAIPAAAVIATVVGKSVKRYLLPAYERDGWWRESIRDAEPDETQAFAPPRDRPITGKLRSAGRAGEPPASVKEPSR